MINFILYLSFTNCRQHFKFFFNINRSEVPFRIHFLCKLLTVCRENCPGNWMKNCNDAIRCHLDINDDLRNFSYEWFFNFNVYNFFNVIITSVICHPYIYVATFEIEPCICRIAQLLRWSLHWKYCAFMVWCDRLTSHTALLQIPIFSIF